MSKKKIEPDNRKPCVNCGQLIQPLAHWSESYCYTYLKNRIAQLEQELHEQHDQTINLLAHIADAQQSELRHSCSVMSFQFGKTKLAISTGNRDEAFNAGKTLASAGIKILKYLGKWS